MSFALGPYFGMLLINQFNFIVLFLVCTGLSICSLYITMKLSKRKAIPLETQSLKVQSFISREALPPAIIALMLNIIWGTLSAFIPLYALRHGVSNPGIFFAILAITLILGRALGGKILDIYNKEKLIIPCLAIIIVSVVILLFSTTLTMLILVAVFLGAGWAFIYPLLLIYAIENTGSARGLAMGTFTALADLGAGIGPMIMGVILQWTSYSIMFSCLIFVSVINFLYFYCAIGRKGKNVDTSTAPNPVL